MLEWWTSFAPSKDRHNDRTDNPTTNIFRKVRILYISINKDHYTVIESEQFQNVKDLFKKYIEQTIGTNTRQFNDNVFNYSWNVICLWLMEFAGSHKTCNQRKSQYNLMTVPGRTAAISRTYNSKTSVIPERKREIDKNFTNNLRESAAINEIERHLTAIYGHYQECCYKYRTVSSTLLESEVYQRMHIWDNFRRIIRYVNVIRDAYMNYLSGQGDNDWKKTKIIESIKIVEDKIMKVNTEKARINEELENHKSKSARIHGQFVSSANNQLADLEKEFITYKAKLDEYQEELKKDLNVLDPQKYPSTRPIAANVVGTKRKGGTRHKRRQPKSNYTRRLRKPNRTSKRTRRVRKPSRKSKTRRRVKK